jgi:8-oxo-dGTP diphosphatase
MARVPVLAAGGIVLRRQHPPLVAVVRLRKRDEWVLPKGKLDAGETPRAAAKREVLEETGHDVTVHEFLGTLAYDIGGRSKIVHYWRMEAAGEQAYELMHDIRAVDWLPLDAAIARLSRNYEQAFLEHVGPQAVSAFTRRPRAKAPPLRKRRSPPAPMQGPPVAEVAPVPILGEQVAEVPRAEAIEPQLQPAPMLELAADSPLIADRAAVVEEISLCVTEPETEAGPIEIEVEQAETPDGSDEIADSTSIAAERQRRSLAQKVRDWLVRAA